MRGFFMGDDMSYGIKVESGLAIPGKREYVAVATYKGESCTAFDATEGRARNKARANMIAYAHNCMKDRINKGGL